MQSLDLCYPSALRRDSIILAIQSLYAHPVQESVRVSIFTDRTTELSPSIDQAIAKLQKTIPQLNVFGLKERQKTIDALSSYFDPELLHYALFPPADGTGWGVNVNVSMLYSSGNLLVSTDDDIISKPKKLKPSFIQNLFDSAIAKNNPEEQLLLYFKSNQDLFFALQDSDLNILQTYIDIFKTNTHLQEQILWINPGLYGDSGMGSARGILSLTGSSRSFVMQNYDSLKFSRKIINCHINTLVSKKTNLMAGQTAFYNKVPLVPFIPFGRNCDGLSGLLMRLIYPKSKSAYTNFVVDHQSDANLISERESLVTLNPSIAELIMTLAIVNQQESEDPFYYYGDLFSSIGSLSNSDFIDQVHGSFSLQFMAVLDYYKKLLDDYSRSPSDWAKDMDSHIQKIQEKLRDPLSIFMAQGCKLSIERAKFHIHHYGELLKIWPSLWQKAKDAF